MAYYIYIYTNMGAPSADMFGGGENDINHFPSEEVAIIDPE